MAIFYVGSTDRTFYFVRDSGIWRIHRKLYSSPMYLKEKENWCIKILPLYNWKR